MFEQNSPPPNLNSHPDLDKIIFFETLDSTSLEAHRRRAEFNHRNILFVSNEQTAGKGQQGRSWDSKAGMGLWMSLLLGRPEHVGSDLQRLSLYCGLVAYKTISEFVDSDITLKWPNDVMIGGEKCGGILTEIQWMGTTAITAIVGIGINLKHALTDFPEAIRSTATSLFQAGWKKPDRVLVLNRFIAHFFHDLDMLKQPERLTSEWNAHAYMLNELIHWNNGEQTLQGHFLGLDITGRACIRIQGAVHKFRTGELRLRSS